MTTRRSACQLVLIGFLLGLGMQVAAATSDPVAAIESARAAIEASTLDDAARQAGLAEIEAALAEEREADALEKRLAELRTEAASQPARTAQLQKALTVDRDLALAEWERRLPARADQETLEKLLDQERDTIDGIDAQIDQVGADLVAALSRPAQTTGEIGRLSRRIEELSVPGAEVAGEDPLIAQARRRVRSSRSGSSSRTPRRPVCACTSSP